MVSGSSEKGRLPPFDFHLSYNVTRDEIGESPYPVWEPLRSLPRLDEPEAAQVRRDVTGVFSRYVSKSLPSADELSYHVYDKGFDRTVYYEIDDDVGRGQVYSHWVKVAPQAVSHVQKMLRTKHPEWRVLIPGHEDEADAFFIYPDGLVFSAKASGNNDRQRILWSARRRQLGYQRREAHRAARSLDIRRRLMRRWSVLRTGDTPSVVAWYKTLSEPTYDSGREGDPGTSVWILFPSALENASESPVQCADDFYSRWHRIARDGTFVETVPDRDAQVLPVLEVTSDDRVVDALTVGIAGQVLRLSSKGID